MIICTVPVTTRPSLPRRLPGPLTQVAMGILAGAILVTLVVSTITGGTFSTSHALAIIGYALLMMAVCMLACVVPTRRALRVAPADAMRVDA
jgi:putative ABC transport system permease protein